MPEPLPPYPAKMSLREKATMGAIPLAAAVLLVAALVLGDFTFGGHGMVLAALSIVVLGEGTVCAIIADNKGRDTLGWFVLGALGFLIALVVLLLLPPAIGSPNAGHRRCPHCRSTIPIEAAVCRHCTRDV